MAKGVIMVTTGTIAARDRFMGDTITLQPPAFKGLFSHLLLLLIWLAIH